MRAHDGRSVTRPKARRRVGRTGQVIAGALVSVLTALTLGAGRAAADGSSITPLTTESFTNATTADGNWVTPGSTNVACLTAGTSTSQKPIPACSTSALDTPGSGTLRLTDNAKTRVGTVYNTISLPGAQGLDITFNTYQYNGTGADGIAFVLAATDPSAPHPPTVLGPSGGSLGYSTYSTNPGVSYGYLGFGLDVFGNFENNPYGGADCGSSATAAPQSITVRGPGNGTSGYCVVNTTQLSGGAKLDNSSATSRPAAVPVEIAINPSASTATSTSGLSVPAKSFAFEVTPLGGATRTVIGALPTAGALGGYGFPSAWYNSTTGVPYQLTFGWAASTGGSTEIHDVNTLDSQSLNGKVPVYDITAGDNENSSLVAGGNAVISVTPSLQAQGDEAQPVTVTTTLPSGITAGTVTSSDYSCTTSGQTVTCSYGAGATAGTSLPTLQIPVTVTAASAGSGSVGVKVSSNDSLPAATTYPLSWSVFTASAAPSSTTHGNAVTLTATVPSAATGDVTFTSGGTTLCTAHTPGYSCATSADLDAGTYPVTASWSDPDYGDLTTTTSFTIGKATSPSFAASVGAASVSYGTTDTLAFSGLAADATGTVTFTSGGTTLCTATLPATSCETSATLTPGTYPVTATYGGDGNYQADTAGTSFDVTKADTAIAAGVADATVPYQHTATLTVGSVPGEATGTVTFTSGGSTLCTITLPATSCETSDSLAPGTYAVTATYGGDDDYAGSSDTTSFTVSKGLADGLTVSAVPASAQYGSPVTLAFSGLPGAATGSVTFTAGGTTLCTVADVTTASSCVTSDTLAVASYPVTATYSGDDTYETGTADTSFAITKAAGTSFAASVAASSLSYGTTETLLFSGLPSGATGSVTFTAGGTTLCTVADVTTASSCQPPASLAPGSYPVTATYSGDDHYLGTSATTSFTVTEAATSLGVTARSTALKEGQSQTLTATGLPSGATGTVTFTSGGTTLCATTLPAVSCTAADLPAGTYHVTATYSGDVNHAGSTAAVSFTVAAAPEASTTTSTPTGTSTTLPIAGTNGARSVSISTSPAHGTAKLVNGRLIYTPDPAFTGVDTVVVKIVNADGSISYRAMHLRVTAASAKAGRLADTGFATHRTLLLALALLDGGAVLLVLAYTPFGSLLSARGRHRV